MPSIARYSSFQHCLLIIFSGKAFPQNFNSKSSLFIYLISTVCSKDVYSPLISRYNFSLEFFNPLRFTILLNKTSLNRNLDLNSVTQTSTLRRLVSCNTQARPNRINRKLNWVFRFLYSTDKRGPSNFRPKFLMISLHWVVRCYGDVPLQVTWNQIYLVF